MSDEVQAQDEATAFDPENYFPPKPGGLVDSLRKDIAKREAAFHEQIEKDEIAAGAVRPAYAPVTTKIRQPDEWGARTITLAPGTSQMAMPADKDRKRGMINLITAPADGDPAPQVLIAKDRSAADSGTGYVLVYGQEPVVLEHSRECWLSNVSSVTIQVSIFSESYSRE